MISLTRPRSAGWLLLVTLACRAEPATAGPAVELPRAGTSYYGIYLKGAKVGWMRTSVVVGREVRTAVQLEGSVGGMGAVSRISLNEERRYAAADGRLLGLSFSQAAATGAVKVSGERRGELLRLRIDAGGASQTQELPVAESLADVVAAERLARRAEVGAQATVRRFDPSLQRVLIAEQRVAAVEPRALGGVTVKTVRIDTRYPELGVEESSWHDDTGKVLESQVGGFFVARLEAEEEAKRLDFHQDVLVSAAVRLPRPIDAPERLAGLRLRLRGFGETLPPSSARQQVRRDGEVVVVELRRDAPPPPTSLAPRRVPPGADLEATPFIQVDAPEIQAAAARAAAGASDAFAASAKLAAFVYRHVRDEYVPAYSNALEALKSGRGDCTEHATLFVALARAVGLPARVAVGVAYWPPGGGLGWHAWAEVRVGEQWIAVDPTWNQPIADATHIKLADGGPAEQARIVMLLGRLEVTAMELL